MSVANRDRELPKPKRLRAKTLDEMEEAFEYVIGTRVATARQIARAVGLSEPDAKAKLRRYPYLYKRHMPLRMYQNGEWVDSSRVNVYMITQDTMLDYERLNGLARYRANLDRDPVPHTETINRLLLVSELYSMVYRHNKELYMMPNLWLDTILHEKHGVDNPGRHGPGRPPVLCGMQVIGSELLFGVNIFDWSNISGLIRFINRIREPGLDFQLLVLVTGNRSGDAVHRCIFAEREGRFRNAFGIYILPYEWAIKNPGGFSRAIAGQHEQILTELRDHYLRTGCKWRKASNGSFQWEIEHVDGKKEYVDTTIGRPTTWIRTLLTESTHGVPHTLWVATEEEREVFHMMTLKTLVNVQCKVINWRIE